MEGIKAGALARLAERLDAPSLRFDYSGHGRSGGVFADRTLSDWIADALAAFDALTEGPQVVAGSSMGAFIACHLARLRPDRVAALVLLAPALDFTERLIEPGLSSEARGELERRGVWNRPSPYGSPIPITRALLEDGRRWSLLPGPVRLEAPVRILQGTADADVPEAHALGVFRALEAPASEFVLVAGADHRLSRPADIALFEEALLAARGRAAAAPAPRAPDA